MCAMQDTAVCVAGFTQAKAFVDNYMTPSVVERIREAVPAGQEAINAVNVSIMMQFAHVAVSNSVEILVNPVLVTIDTAEWNPLGCWFLLEWVTGKRQLVSLQGHNGAMTLVSAVIGAPNKMKANSAEVPQSILFVLNVAVQYVAFMLTVLAAIILVYAMISCFNVVGLHLFQFKCVAAVTWIGRPLIFVCGVVAVCMLSTSQPLLHESNNFDWMDDIKRGAFINILAAGECSWLLCVTIDLLVFMRGWTYAITVAILLLVLPPENRRTVNSQSKFVGLEVQIECHSGTIMVGSLSRVITITVIITVGVLRSIVLAHCCFYHATLLDDATILPGIAQETYRLQDSIRDGSWHLDRASAAMAGLPSVVLSLT